MSQGGAFSSGGSGPSTGLETLTGNSGGAVSGDISNNIDVVGSNANGINIVGNPGANTLTVSGIQATTTQIGVNTLATNAEAIAGTDTVKSITSDDLKAKLGTQTAHTVALFEGSTSALSPSNAGTDGQVLLGATGADPAFATLTSTGNTITFTPGPNSLNLEASGGSSNTITGNSGGAISPSAGNWNTLGTGSITIVGSGSTLTTQLTGLTNHNVLVGAGSATVTNVDPGAISGIPLVSNGAAADPSFSTALIVGGGTSSTSFNTTGVVISGATATTALTSVTLGDGELAIGSSAGNPAAATLTAGTGISISNGNNSITINATGTGVSWINVTGSTQAISSGNGYLSNNAGTVTFSLPASGTIGDTFQIAGVQGGWIISQSAGQQILFGNMSSTSGVTGSLSSTDSGDCLSCVATNTSASTVWRVISTIGNITVV